MNDAPTILSELNDRSREVFRRVVEGYLESGDPIGSRTLTRTMSEHISPATIRNVMQDLEHLGLLDSAHTSAGRTPTHLGLRMFVDGLLEVGDVALADRQKIDANSGNSDINVATLLDNIGATLSGITQGASVVLAPKQDATIRHIEFVSLSVDRVLAVLVFTNGHLENRIFTPPPGQTPSSMREAANFLNALADGKTFIGGQSERLHVAAKDAATNRGLVVPVRPPNPFVLSTAAPTSPLAQRRPHRLLYAQRALVHGMHWIAQAPPPLLWDGAASRLMSVFSSASHHPSALTVPLLVPH